MKRHLILVFSLVVMLPLAAPQTAKSQEQKPQLIYVKHLEPPLHYPPLARAARLSGTIVIKLKIAANGTVLSVESSPLDKNTTGFDILKADAERIVKTWTFGCVGCAPDTPFEHTIRFRYGFGEDPPFRDLYSISMNLPGEVTLISEPVICDHCSSSKPSKKGNH